jgi:hypothetical protein
LQIKECRAEARRYNTHHGADAPIGGRENMSALGRYAVLRRAAFPECVERAKNIRTQTRGRWIFKNPVVVGMEEFKAAWAEALVEEATFGYSGYVIRNYFDAQEHVNSVPNRYERTETALALTKAFTAAFPFEEKETFAELPPEKLAAWRREEYGEDADGMAEAITAAHAFYQEGLAKITPETVVVFLII